MTTPTDLFGDPEPFSKALAREYAVELLANPPVQSLGPDRPDRYQQSVRLARKDVTRFFRVLARLGYEVVKKGGDAL